MGIFPLHLYSSLPYLRWRCIFGAAATFESHYTISTACDAMGTADGSVITEAERPVSKKHPKINYLRMFHRLLILLFVFKFSFLL